MEGLGLLQPKFEVAELGPGHAGSGKIVAELLQHDFASDWSRLHRALGADKRGVLGGPRCNECGQVAEVSGCEDGDLVIDAEVDGCQRKKAAPTGEYDRFRLSVMGAGSKPCRYTEGVSFEVTATNTQRGAKNEDVGTWGGLAAPVTFRGDIFVGGGSGSGRLPLAEFTAEGAYAVGLLGDRSVIAPDFDEGAASVLGVLDGGPIGERAAMGASGFVE